MPPRARARSRSASGPVSLTDDDVAALREKLQAGKKPRVTLLVNTALGPAGTSVPVVGFEEPAVGEFISVRLRDDVVPFSPAELSLPTRGRPSAVKETPPAAAASTPQKKPAPPRLVAVPEPEYTPVPPEPKSAAQAPAVPPSAATPPAPAKAPSRRPARGNISVTLRFSGKGWTYESTRGGRRSTARPLNLAAVRAFSDRLDDPALRKDLQATVDIARQEAQSKADALRAELERVEVELADLDE